MERLLRPCGTAGVPSHSRARRSARRRYHALVLLSGLRHCAGQQGPAGVGAAAKRPAVSFEVFPSPTCPNCRLMVKEGLLPLAEAGLPSDQVVVKVTPWVTGTRGADGTWRSGAKSGSEYDLLCSQQLCALKGKVDQLQSNFLRLPTGDHPALGASSHELLQALRFAECQMRQAQLKTMEGQKLLESVAACAAEAGFHWDGPGGLKECAEEGEGLRIQHGEGMASSMNWIYQQPLWTSPPYLFVNGRPLNCPSPTYCTSWLTPQGHEPLKVNGSLVDVACSILDPPPLACLARKQQRPVTTNTSTVTEYCETCYEVGSFQWRYSRLRNVGPLPTGWLLALVAALFASGAAVGVACGRARRPRGGTSRGARYAPIMATSEPGLLLADDE